MTSRKIVLVVEDDLLLRIITADLVEEAGFEALEAANADEAVAILEVRDDVRVVLTDVDMPGSMDGAKLAAAIRDRWPPVEMIVISGKRIKSEIILPERVMFFSKPYDVDELIAELHRLAVLKSVHPLNHSAAAPWIPPQRSRCMPAPVPAFAFEPETDRSYLVFCPEHGGWHVGEWWAINGLGRCA